jgi:capsular polysaccharide export protein
MEERRGEIGIFSAGLRRLAGLADVLDAQALVFRPNAQRAATLSAVAGWGHKPTAAGARAYAQQHGLPYLALEDGFLRSVGLGASEPALSLVVDDLGIYYDARGTSRLEQLLESLAGGALEDEALLKRSAQCRSSIVTGGVSKYNDAPDELPPEIANADDLVIVADQTYDDASVVGALADASSFEAALEAALAEHPGARVVVKVHPATVAGKKRGYLAQRRGDARMTMVSANVNPQALLRRARHLYVVSSQLGFEGLLAGIPVSCFGQPFYSGWGLTRDRQRCARRTRHLSLDQLVAGALLLYPRYRHPISGDRCEAEQVIEHLALQRRIFAENRRHFVCFDMSYWKRPFVRRYLRAPGRKVKFVRSTNELRGVPDTSELTAVVWASRKTPQLSEWAEQRRIPLWHMEDGFLRSAGLGSDLTAPGSLVLDPDGIYYDPSRPSRLENLLQTADFSAVELERARKLRELVVNNKISKYNLPAADRLDIMARPGQRIVLVPGQVADDASVRLGAQSVGDNLSLLRAVRSALPEAYIIYKPHPDVLSGNRQGRLHDTAAPPWDLLVGQVPISACLAAAHEVHTMTSLVGFEALLRALPVVTYGQPFYAGWGLTRDLAPLARRTRRLSLDELVAGALLRYPRYVSWRSGCFCTAEDKVQELALTQRPRFGFARLPRLAIKLSSLAASGREWWRGRELRRG